MERTRDIQKHRIQMMTKKEHKEREEREADQEMLQQKRAHDLKVGCVVTPHALFNPFPHCMAALVAVPPSTAGEGCTSPSGGN